MSLLFFWLKYRNIRNVSACLKNNHKNFNIECAVLVFFPFLFCFCFLLQLFCCCCLCLISELASMPMSGFVPEFAVTFFKIDQTESLHMEKVALNLMRYLETENTPSVPSENKFQWYDIQCLTNTLEKPMGEGKVFQEKERYWARVYVLILCYIHL